MGLGAPTERIQMSGYYHVKDWKRHFENAKSRSYERCNFVCVPNKQHGMGMTMILSNADGLMIYGVWQLIIGALSQQRQSEDGQQIRDGYLTDTGRPDGKPWTLETMSIRWRCKKDHLEAAINFILSEDVGWIEFISQYPAGIQPVSEQYASKSPELIRTELNELNELNRNEQNASRISKPSGNPIEDSHAEAFEAFDKWSHVGRTHGLDASTNEHKPIRELVDRLSQEPAIIRDGGMVKRHLLIGLVVDGLIKDRKEFKSPAYAAKTVENYLKEWALKGIPGNKPAKKAEPVLAGPREYGPQTGGRR